MAASSAESVEAYLEELPAERREAIEAVRRVVLEHLPEGYEEQMAFGMISYVVPLERYPQTYNKQPLSIAALASQKNYMSLYLMGVYGDPDLEQRFTEGYRAAGKRLDMGKSCVRFKRLDDLPLDVVAAAIEAVPVDDYIERYEASREKR